MQMTYAGIKIIGEIEIGNNLFSYKAHVFYKRSSNDHAFTEVDEVEGLGPDGEGIIPNDQEMELIKYHAELKAEQELTDHFGQRLDFNNEE